jgi:type IV pilus assembly protein PilF
MYKFAAMSISLAISLAVLAGCSTKKDSSHANTKSAQVHTELAGLYFERAQAGIALDELDKALQADSDYAPAYGMRGLVHMSLREDKEAEEDFQKSLRLDKTDSETQNNYGWFLCQRGREKEAIPHFMAAVKNPLYKTPALAYLNAGICSQQIGSNKDAEEFLQKALQIQPGMPQALFAMAQLSFSVGDYASAKRYFARFSEKNDNLSAEQLWLAVRIERKLGNRNSEASYGSQLRRRFPDARETQLMMRGE